MNYYCPYCHKVHDKFKPCDKKIKARKELNNGDRHNPHYKALVHSNTWTKEAIYIRDKYNNMCLVCKEQGIIKQCDSVHHIVKVLSDDSKVFDEHNLIPLCTEHHREAETGNITKEKLYELVDRYGNES